MTNKQIWLIGTDANGRTKYGAPNTVNDFDLETDIGSRLTPGNDHVLFCFRKKQQMVGAAAYIHANEPGFNRRGSYAGVAVEFVRDQVPHPDGIFACFEQVIKLYKERLERGANNILTFNKSLAETFADWDSLKTSLEQKLNGKFPVVCQAVPDGKSPVMVHVANLQLIGACFIAFLQQSEHQEMYLTADANFECFKTHMTLDMNSLLLQGVANSTQFLGNEISKLRTELGEARQKYHNLQKTLNDEHEKWQQKENALSEELRNERIRINDLVKENKGLMQQGNSVVQQGKELSQRHQRAQKHAHEARKICKGYRDKYSYLFNLRNS